MTRAPPTTGPPTRIFGPTKFQPPLAYLAIGRARRPLMAFVMVLSHSRQIFLRFFPDARMENFLHGHVGAFAA